MASQERFRGLRSAASLKPHHQTHPAAVPAGFRGLRSAASLKQHPPPELADDPLRIPRTQIRGLIEARTDEWGEVPVMIPRTQIRGLIEARYPATHGTW